MDKVRFNIEELELPPDAPSRITFESQYLGVWDIKAEGKAADCRFAALQILEATKGSRTATGIQALMESSGFRYIPNENCGSTIFFCTQKLLDEAYAECDAVLRRTTVGKVWPLRSP